MMSNNAAKETQENTMEQTTATSRDDASASQMDSTPVCGLELLSEVMNTAMSTEDQPLSLAPLLSSRALPVSASAAAPAPAPGSAPVEALAINSTSAPAPAVQVPQARASAPALAINVGAPSETTAQPEQEQEPKTTQRRTSFEAVQLSSSKQKQKVQESPKASDTTSIQAPHTDIKTQTKEERKGKTEETRKPVNNK